MSRTFITKKDVPKFVRSMLSRSVELDAPYMIRIYNKNRVCSEVRFRREIDRLIKWCNRFYAEAKIIESDHRTFVDMYITDPVMHQFEKDSFYKKLD